jgi:hypothetical protein
MAERLRRLVTQSQPSAVVGAAACGADLLVLEAALALRARRGRPDVEVILPTPLHTFRLDSVEEPWRHRFDAVVGVLDAEGALHTLDLGSDEEAYRRANERILTCANERADAAGERVVALVVASPGEGEAV